MKQYTYKARDMSSQLVEGSIEAEDAQSAANLLATKKLFTFDIKEESKKFGFSLFNGIRTKEKVFFIRQLATMTKAGLPIAQSLSTLAEQTVSKPLKKMIDQMITDIEAGNSLSQAFKNHGKVFSPTDISMITSGEASGKLDEILESMAEQSDKSYKAIKKIRNAFIYPAFLLLVITAIVVIMLVFVLPQMEGLYKSFGNAQLPLPTRILMAVSKFLRHFYLLVAGGVVISIVGLRALTRRGSGRYFLDRIKIRIPLLGKFLQMSYIGSVTRTLSGLVSSGVPILDSLKIVSETIPNVIYQNAILEVQNKVKQGKNLSTSLKENHLFPIMLSQMVGVGENTGELDNMLKNLADYYSDEIDNWVKGFQSLLEPVMIVTMGLIVGSIILSIIMPIYNLANVIK